MASTTTPAASIPTDITKKADPDDGDFVDLIVGGYPYRTTRSVLLSSPFHSGDDESYFHALLSERWKRTKISEPIEIPDVNGRLFLYVLYFLQLGELPRSSDSSAYHSILTKEEIDALESQADFFGLTRLVELCKATKDMLKGVRGTGDLDLTPFSDFSVINEKCRNSRDRAHTMRYKYKNDTKIGVHICEENFDEDCLQTIYVYTSASDDKKKNKFTEIFDVINYGDGCVFEALKEIVRDEYEKKSTKDETVSVTRVLDRIDIEPELQLWFAFFIHDIIDCVGSEQGFDRGGNVEIDFMLRDDSIFTSMKNVA